MLDRTQHSCLHKHFGDAVARRLDPTGTSDIRARFSSDMARRWAKVRVAAREAILQQNILGLGPPTVATLMRSMAGDPVRTFQSFIDEALGKIVLGGEGGWLSPYLQEAAWRARSRAARGIGLGSAMPRDRTDTVVRSGAIVELQGVMEAVSQQAVRAIANGLIMDMKPRVIADMVGRIITKVGVTRSKALVNFSVVRAYNMAALDAMEDMGVTRVSVDPEFVRRPRIVDADEELVEVLTAGDDLVCQECEDISEDGPYEISEARGLIPAHPNCRCAFVPWDDDRFAEVERDSGSAVDWLLWCREAQAEERLFALNSKISDADWNEEDHPRDPDGRFAGGGGVAAQEEEEGSGGPLSAGELDKALNSPIKGNPKERSRIISALETATGADKEKLQERLVQSLRMQAGKLREQGNTTKADQLSSRADKYAEKFRQGGTHTRGGGRTPGTKTDPPTTGTGPKEPDKPPAPPPPKAPDENKVLTAGTKVDMERAFRDRHGVRVSWDSRIDEKRALEVARTTSAALDDIKERFPGMNQYSDLNAIKFEHGDRIDHDGKQALGLYYMGGRGWMRLAAGLRSGDGDLTRGGWTVTTDNLANVFRHEYGHSLDQGMIRSSGRDNVVGKSGLRLNQWFDRVKADKNFSTYGKTSIEEAWAETISAYTHPRYDYPANSLRIDPQMKQQLDRLSKR